MDRCRCDEYAAAVKKLKFFTVGTYRPDIIENYDRSQFVVAWRTNAIYHEDRRFKKPIAWKKPAPDDLSKDAQAERRRRINDMWCPYMTPVKRTPYEYREN